MSSGNSNERKLSCRWRQEQKIDKCATKKNDRHSKNSLPILRVGEGLFNFVYYGIMYSQKLRGWASMTFPIEQGQDTIGARISNFVLEVINFAREASEKMFGFSYLSFFSSLYSEIGLSLLSVSSFHSLFPSFFRFLGGRTPSISIAPQIRVCTIVAAALWLSRLLNLVTTWIKRVKISFVVVSIN